MEPLPQPDELDELRNRLRLTRLFIARLNNSAMNDVDALLSVAEVELERMMAAGHKSR